MIDYDFWNKVVVLWNKSFTTIKTKEKSRDSEIATNNASEVLDRLRKTKPKYDVLQIDGVDIDDEEI